MAVFAEGLFAGDVVCVTGGGTGIGRACALELGRLGARVVIASRREEHLAGALAELTSTGAEALAHPCDIRDEASIDRLLDAVDARFGRLDVLVNNAGGQFPSPAVAIEAKGWEAVVRNNLNGTFFMTRAVARRFFIPASGGRIVNVIANVDRGFPGMAHTGAARAGVDNLTKTLAVEWVVHGIRVNAVAPGVIDTEAISRYPKGLVEGIRTHIPMKRLGTVDEVAALIVFLASPAASYVTGETVYVDGGARLWGSPWPIPDPD